MKQIKFRGKSILTGQWIYGNLLQSEIDVNQLNVKSAICERFADNYNIRQHEVIPESVGQYNGLMDILTKDGYEGDIIERDASDGKGNVRGLIVFESGQFRCKWGDEKKGWNNSLYLHLCDSKIIGNIHDNPDLIWVV